MDYTRVDPTETAAGYKRAAALEAEREAYGQELEDLRLAELETNGANGAIRNAAAHARLGLNVAERRARAELYVADAGVDGAEIAALRRAHLTGWIEQLEREHVSHTTRIGLLDLEGPGHGQAERVASEQALEVLETAHATALAKLAELGPEPPA